MNIALITGGSRGLGKSMAEHLAKRGIDSIITYNAQKEAADSVVAEIRAKGRKATALQLDVTKHQSFEGFAVAVKSALSTVGALSTYHLASPASVIRAMRPMR